MAWRQVWSGVARLAVALGVLLCLAAAAGCGGTREVPSPFESGGGGGGSGSISVNAVNNNFNEATIRAVYRGERRLGIVPGNGRASFTIPWPATNELRIRIDVLAGDRFTTNRVSVTPGETVYLTIENPLRRSSLRR